MSEELKKQFKDKRMAAMPVIGKEITDYCLEHNIKNVVFLDRSARPAAHVFRKQWNATQNPKERPNTYFVAPKVVENGASEDEVNLFKNEHPYLVNDKDGATLLFDVCVKRGSSLYNLNDVMQKSGFTNIHSMVTGVHSEQKQYFTPNRVIFDDHSLGCHLFGNVSKSEVGVERNDYSFLAKRSENRSTNVPQNRKELSDAISAFYQQTPL